MLCYRASTRTKTGPTAHPGRPPGVRPTPLWDVEWSHGAAVKGSLRQPPADLDCRLVLARGTCPILVRSPVQSRQAGAKGRVVTRPGTVSTGCRSRAPVRTLPPTPNIVRTLCRAQSGRPCLAPGLHNQHPNRAVNRSGGGSTKVPRGDFHSWIAGQVCKDGAGVTKAVSPPRGRSRGGTPGIDDQGVTMRTTSLLKMAMGTGAVLLVFAVAPATVASASPPTFVPCSSGAAGLVAAINAANGSGGGTISLASGCTYALDRPRTTARTACRWSRLRSRCSATAPPSRGRAPSVSSRSTVPGGNLSLRNVTLTGGSASDFGGAIFNSSGTVTLNQSVVTGNSAVTAGGGIASGTFGPSTATLTLNGSVVTNNSSPGTGQL